MDKLGLESLEGFISQREKNRFQLLYAEDYLRPNDELLPYRDDKKITVLTAEERITVPSFADYLYWQRLHERFYRGFSWDDDKNSDLRFDFDRYKTHARVYGSLEYNLSYGSSVFLVPPTSYLSVARPQNKKVKRGFQPDPRMAIHFDGKVGRKTTVDIDYSNLRHRHESSYALRYKGDASELVQEINAGNIDLNLPHSDFIFYEGNTKKAFGIDTSLRKGKLTAKMIASFTRGITKQVDFKGASQTITKKVSNLNYLKYTYFIVPDDDAKPSTMEIWIDRENSEDTSSPYARDIAINQNGVSYSGTFVPLTNYRDYIVKRHSYYGLFLIEMKVNIKDNHTVLIRYRRTNGNDVSGGETNTAAGGDGRVYRYLKDANDELPKAKRLSHHGVYRLGHTDLLEDGFGLTIVEHQLETPVDLGFTYNKNLQVDFAKGLVVFKDPFPFNNDNPDIYEYNPNSTDAKYLLKLHYSYRKQNFLLDFNIVPGSEIVYLDSRQLKRKKDYYIDYRSGYLSFASHIKLNKESNISVVYEYSPLGQDLQEVMLGASIGYDAFDFLYFRIATMWTNQTVFDSAPMVGKEPKSILILDGLANFSLSPLLAVDPDEFAWDVNLEVAKSWETANVYDSGIAIIDNMEGAEETFSLKMKAEKFQISSPPAGVMGPRGKLIYRDYRDPNDNYRLRDFSFSGFYTVPYSIKPGPYNIWQNHLDQSQINEDDRVISGVFEYDFSGGDWVSVVYPFRKTKGVDFRQYTEVDMWIRLRQGESVKLCLDIGSINEDADGDGMDTEDDNGNGKLDANEDRGFSFDAYPETRIGGGTRQTSDKIYQGNGQLDSEDLDNNGKLDTEERVITLPGDHGTYNGKKELLIEKNEGGWQHIKIKLNFDNLTADEKTIIQKVKAVRLWLQKNEGDSGQLLISQLKFTGISWKELRIDGVSPSLNRFFIVSSKNTLDDPDYYQERLRQEDEQEYSRLYGRTLANDDAKNREHVMTVRYHLADASQSYGVDDDGDGDIDEDPSGQPGAPDFTKKYDDDGDGQVDEDGAHEGTITKLFNAAMDFSPYRSIYLWIYADAVCSKNGEDLVVRFGPSDNVYFEYRRKIDWKGWKRLEIDLRTDDYTYEYDSTGRVVSRRKIADGKPDDLYLRTEGPYSPTLRKIKRFTLGVQGNGSSGELWINDIYLDNVDTREDIAWKLGTETKLRDWYTAAAKYKYIGSSFVSIGQDIPFYETQRWSGDFSFTRIKFLPLSFHFQKEDEEANEDTLLLPSHDAFNNNRSSFTFDIGFDPSQEPYWGKWKGQVPILHFKLAKTDDLKKNLTKVESLKQKTSEASYNWLLSSRWKVPLKSRDFRLAIKNNMSKTHNDTRRNRYGTISDQLYRSYQSDLGVDLKMFDLSLSPFVSLKEEYADQYDNLGDQPRFLARNFTLNARYGLLEIKSKGEYRQDNYNYGNSLYMYGTGTFDDEARLMGQIQLPFRFTENIVKSYTPSFRRQVTVSRLQLPNEMARDYLGESYTALQTLFWDKLPLYYLAMPFDAMEGMFVGYRNAQESLLLLLEETFSSNLTAQNRLENNISYEFHPNIYGRVNIGLEQDARRVSVSSTISDKFYWEPDISFKLLDWWYPKGKHPDFIESLNLTLDYRGEQKRLYSEERLKYQNKYGITVSSRLLKILGKFSYSLQEQTWLDYRFVEFSPEDFFSLQGENARSDYKHNITAEIEFENDMFSIKKIRHNLTYEYKQKWYHYPETETAPSVSVLHFFGYSTEFGVMKNINGGLHAKTTYDIIEREALHIFSWEIGGKLKITF